MKYPFIFVLAFIYSGLIAQISINSDGSSADPSAILDVKSTSGGLLIPTMTQAQRTAIAGGSPAPGLIVYQTDAGASGKGFYLYKDVITGWTPFRGKKYYSGNVTIGGVDVIDSEPALTLSDPGTGPGDVQINFPSLGASGLLPTVLIVPAYDILNTTIPYCPAEFLNTCNVKDHFIWFEMVNIGSGNTHIWHTPMDAECAGTANNYELMEYINGLPPGDIYTNDSLCAGVDDFFFNIQGQSGASDCTSYDFFIDWNQDGDFEDTGELVASRLWGCDDPSWLPTAYNNPPPAFPQAIGPFTTPATAATGKTRLRVTARSFGQFDMGIDPSDESCNNDNTQGSTKDYDIFIKDGSTPAGVSSQKICNVFDLTTTSVRVLCYDLDGTSDNVKFHFKIIEN